MSKATLGMNTRYDSLSRKKNSEPRGLNSFTTENNEDLSGKTKESLKLLSVPIRNEMNNYHDPLNCIIHIFYYLKEIRLFILTEDISTDPRFMIFSELKNLYDKYEEILLPETKVGEKFRFLDPLELRREISILFSEEKKFKMNETDDISDLLFAFLNAFHSYTIGTKSLKYICEKQCPKVCVEHNLNELIPCPYTCENYDHEFRNLIPKVCIAHNLFYFELLEQVECECGGIGDVFQGNYFSFVYELEIKKVLPYIQNKDISSFKYKLFEIMRVILEKDAVCPKNRELCSGKVKRITYLVNTPKYFVINMSWKEVNPKLYDICKLFFLISHQFKMLEIFEPTVINARTTRKYEIFCIISYWNNHYVSYIKHEVGEETFWVKNNDMIITKLNNYTEVVIDCMHNHFHPVLLFYKRIDNDKGSVNDAKEYIIEKQIQNIIEYCEKTDIQSLSNYIKEKPLLRPNLSIKSVNSSMNEYLRRSKEMKSKNESMLDESSHKYRKDSENEMKRKNTFTNREEKTTIIEYLGFSNENFFTNKKEYFINVDKNNLDLNDKVNGNCGNMILNLNESWACEKCSNINSTNKAECIKCKSLNSFIHEMLIQNKFDKTNKKFSDERSLFNQVSQPAKQKGVDNVFRVCENCNQNNFYTKLKCEFCLKNLGTERSNLINTDRKHLTTDSRNTNSNIVKKDKLSSNPTALNIPNTPATLGAFNIDDLFGILQSIKESSYKNLNQKDEIIHSLPIESLNLSRKWKCKNCDKINEKILEYCELCFKNNDDLMNLLQTAARIINKKSNKTEKKKQTVKNPVEYVPNNLPVEDEHSKNLYSKSPSSSPKKVKFFNEPKDNSILQMKSFKSQTSRVEESERKYNERSVQNLNVRRSIAKVIKPAHIDNKKI